MDKKYNNVNSDSQAYTFLSKLPLQLTGQKQNENNKTGKNGDSSCLSWH